MNHSGNFAFLATLLLGSLAVAAPANAQSFYAHDNGLHRGWDNRINNDVQQNDMRFQHRVSDGRDMRDVRLGTDMRDRQDVRLGTDMRDRQDVRLGTDMRDRRDIRFGNDMRDRRDFRLGNDFRNNRVSNDWRFRNPNFINSGRITAFNNNIATTRAQIANRLAHGRINAAQAARLNSRLDNLMAIENSAAASGGGVSLTEFNQLNSRLNSVRIGLMGGLRWY